MAIGPVKRAYIDRVKAAEKAERADITQSRPMIEEEHERRRRRYYKEPFRMLQKPPRRVAQTPFGTLMQGKAMLQAEAAKMGMPRGAGQSGYGRGPRETALDKELRQLTKRLVRYSGDEAKGSSQARNSAANVGKRI